MEATALFARLTTAAQADTWAFFTEARGMNYPQRIDQSISAYRAWLRMDYCLAGIPFEIYMENGVSERDTRIPAWSYSLAVEGKEHEVELMQYLQGLTDLGFDISAGNENLERQMNFSLGLYGACLMHILVRPPQSMSAVEAAWSFMTYMDDQYKKHPVALPVADSQDDDYGFDDGVIFGDWQTWK